MFGLFTRKSNSADERLPTPTPSVSSITRHSPFRFLRSALGTDLTRQDSDFATDSVADGGNPEPPPTATPTIATDPHGTRPLYDLMLTIPPKTLHAYTLAHLSALDTSPPLSPNMITKLATFFSTLAPPPSLHCVRCHKGFYDIENEEKDKACRVPHDDESALVSRISGGGYETLWGCCGQTASGDGSEGPPDGWCYEGRHTTDVKRARFRADSTLHDDKLTSCFTLDCHGTRESGVSPSRNVGTSSPRASNPSPSRSQAPLSARKRPRKSLGAVSSSENEADAESLASRAAKANAKEKEKERGKDRGTTMTADEPPNRPKVKVKARIKSQPISRVRPSSSTRMMVKSRTLLSQSHIHLSSDSETMTPTRPRTRSHVREESRGRTGSKLGRAVMLSGRAKRGTTKRFSRSTTPESEAEGQESEQEERGRDRKKRRVGRG